MPRRLFAVLFVLLAAAAPSMAITDEQVSQSIARMKRFFYAHQDPDTGGWPLPRYDNSLQRGGDTALVVLALLTSGESHQDPRLARAIEYLRGLELRGTYAVSLRNHVWARLPQEFHDPLVADTKWLVAAADHQGRFGYARTPEGATNHGTTHYGTLGLWEAKKRGADVPDSFWENSEEYFLAAQRPDGGWGYDRYSTAYGSMTAAGVTALLIAQQELYRDKTAPDPKASEGIARGMQWLDEKFDGATNPGGAGWNFYYLYAIERVALAGGVASFGGRDWFDAGAEYIFNQQTADDSESKSGGVNNDTIDTSFALMFLARGRVPVWLTKLSLPKQRWNNHHNDAFFLTSYLGDLRESEINWQAMSIDSDPARWLRSPLAFLASDEALELTAMQKAAIKRYLDLGGTLLASPDNGSEPFSKSIRALAEELYPQWPMRPLPPDHLLFSVLHQVPEGGEQVSGVSNGARELILLANRDWGFSFQSEAPPGRNPGWKIATNLWAIVSNRGLLPNRLDPRHEPRAEGAERRKTGEMQIGRVRYTKIGAASLTEPAAWDVLADHVFNRTGLDVTTTDVDLDTLGGSSLPLVHLAGVDAITLTQKQRDAMLTYARAGGTVLIESVGGQGAFASSIERDLLKVVGNQYAPLAPDDRILTGKGLEGGYDCRKVAYRRYAVATLGVTDRPRLAAISFGGRSAIILSREDLSLGVLNVNQWGITGYRRDSALHLMTNLVLSAAAKPAKPE